MGRVVLGAMLPSVKILDKGGHDDMKGQKLKDLFNFNYF